jgi:uncharacterized protein (TIGR02594 family)
MTTVPRRQFLMTSAAIAATREFCDSAAAQGVPIFDPVTQWGFASPQAPLAGPGTRATGSTAARNKEVGIAFTKVLESVKHNETPLEVARYFESLQDKNDDGWPYRAEWPRVGRANPLIVGFLTMSNVLPNEGDQTFWCAAFVNFCLGASGRPLTLSALSGSFRRSWGNGYGQETKMPKSGDIVVFAAKGERGEQGNGHVGFYVGPDQSRSGHILVVGGNQGGITGYQGAVSQSSFPKDGANLILHSFRSVT